MDGSDLLSWSSTLNRFKVSFRLSPTTILFAVFIFVSCNPNASDFTGDKQHVADGTLVNDYCSAIKESSPVVGFAGMGNAYGFFLPLKIEDAVDDRCSISVTFMDNAVPADILKSGESYYAVILLTDIGNLKFNNEVISIKISSSSAEYSAELELIQRPDTRTPGLLLYPTPA